MTRDAELRSDHRMRSENFSEGIDPAIVRQIVSPQCAWTAFACSTSRSNPDHNRSVSSPSPELPPRWSKPLSPQPARPPQLIDLTQQTGVHTAHRRRGCDPVRACLRHLHRRSRRACSRARPACRSGAASVFRSTSTAPQPPGRIASSFEDVRRGQFEGLREAALKDPARRPDVGGPELHSTPPAQASSERAASSSRTTSTSQPSAEISHTPAPSPATFAPPPAACRASKRSA